jgi:hypothetical protein
MSQEVPVTPPGLVDTIVTPSSEEMSMTSIPVQFQTVTTKKYTRVQWSTDGGQTWHEPEDAPVEVARAWQDLQTRTQGREVRP